MTLCHILPKRRGWVNRITRSGRLVEIRWSICISKSQRILGVSSSRTDSGLCIYYLLIWSNLNFLHNSQWIAFPSQLCLLLYSFGANLLHYYYHYYYFTHLRVFHISISWLFFTGVWMTVSLLKFPGCFSVF